MTAPDSSVRPSSRTSVSTTRATRRDHAGVEPREVQTAVETRVLDLHATVGDDVEAGRRSDLRGLVAVEPELHPHDPLPRLDGLTRDAGKLVGAPEDVDDVGLARQLGQRRVAP